MKLRHGRGVHEPLHRSFHLCRHVHPFALRGRIQVRDGPVRRRSHQSAQDADLGLLRLKQSPFFCCGLLFRLKLCTLCFKRLGLLLDFFLLRIGCRLFGSILPSHLQHLLPRPLQFGFPGRCRRTLLCKLNGFDSYLSFTTGERPLPHARQVRVRERLRRTWTRGGCFGKHPLEQRTPFRLAIGGNFRDRIRRRDHCQLFGVKGHPVEQAAAREHVRRRGSSTWLSAQDFWRGIAQRHARASSTRHRPNRNCPCHCILADIEISQLQHTSSVHQDVVWFDV